LIIKHFPQNYTFTKCLGHENVDSGSQTFMVCDPAPKTLNTYGPLLIKRALHYHDRAI